MPTVECSILIHAERSALFTLTQDYDLRLAWDPFLSKAQLRNATKPAVGARAWCVAWYGLGMETEYVSYVPPRVAAVRMTQGPAILAAFAGTWRFEEIGPATTRVVVRYHLRVQPRWLRFLLGPLVLAFFRHDTRLRLYALRRAANKGVCLEHRGRRHG